MIDNYRIRTDLIELNWLGTQDVLVYLNLSGEALVKAVASGEIKVKSLKDGKLRFGILVASQYDNCFHVDSGGRCLYFEPHSGYKISCLMDLRGLSTPHPNMHQLPSPLEVKRAEGEIATLVASEAALDSSSS